MRKLVCLCGFVISLSAAFIAKAETVTLTFDDYLFNNNHSNAIGWTVSEAGYLIGKDFTQYDFLILGEQSNYYTGSPALMSPQANLINYVSLEREDGGLFDFYGIDFSRDVGDITMEFRGYKSDGTFIGQQVVVTAGNPTTLQSFDFNQNAFGDLKELRITKISGNGNLYTYPQMDNIELSQVPIPAAAWLFGSALLGLGWIKRRKTAIGA